MLASLPAQPAGGLQRLSSTASSTKQGTPQHASTQHGSTNFVPIGTPSSKQQELCVKSTKIPGLLLATGNTAVTSSSLEPLFSVLCRHFHLGKLRSDFPSRVEVHADRLEYHFKHPTHGKVHMVMFFRDFGTVCVKKSSLVYKINTVLDMFTAHYSPTDPQHMLSITFDSVKDLRYVYQAVQEGIGAHAAI